METVKQKTDVWSERNENKVPTYLLGYFAFDSEHYYIIFPNVNNIDIGKDNPVPVSVSIQWYRSGIIVHTAYFTNSLS